MMFYYVDKIFSKNVENALQNLPSSIIIMLSN